jgi:muramoyltetrapeptide carboxypeptidase
MKQVLCPPPLNPGDTLGVFAPAGQLQSLDNFYAGLHILKEMGYLLKFPRDLWPGQNYLADSDEMRCQEFNTFLRDQEVKGLVSLRGGYGCLRMLAGIDLALLRTFPKYIIGFSDISILQNYLYGTTGLISLHGPVITSLAGQSLPSLQRFCRSLQGYWHEAIEFSKMEVLISASPAAGHLIGGNLTSLATLIGTEFDFSWDDAIVLLEDINEPPYKVDRMLTQLTLAGKFKKIRGLILGDFSISRQTTMLERLRHREAIWSRVLELFNDKGIPVWVNFPSGHCSDNFVVPIGATAVMDSGKAMLVFS